MTGTKILILLGTLLHICQLSFAVRETEIVRGRVVVSDLPERARNADVYIYTNNGERLHSHCDSDGWFTFYQVPAGSHMLATDILGYVFPEVRIDMSSRHGLIKASYLFNKQQTLPNPLILVPAGAAQYYEKRKPFDVWAFIKSPYGIMICISIFAIFVFPKMKVDPEEYKQLQAELANMRRDNAAEGTRAVEGTRARER